MYEIHHRHADIAGRRLFYREGTVMGGSLKDQAELGEQGKASYFADISTRDPAGRTGSPDDIAQTVIFALTSTFLTGQALHTDDSEPLTAHQKED